MITRQHIESLDDKCLLDALVALATTERHCQIELLLHLGEMDERQLYLGQGYSSLWDYCRRALHFSESVSQQRIVVARAARLYPDLLALLSNGRLTLCTAADLIPALTADNAVALMAQAAGKSRREVQQLAETKGAKPRERDVIRRLAPTAQPATTVEPQLLLIATDRPADAKQEPAAGAPPVENPLPAPVKPRHRIAFTASDEVVKKLERIQKLLGTTTLEDAIDRASEALLDQLDPVRRDQRRRERKAKAPKAASTARLVAPNKEPRRPPLPLRDAVMVRDDVRCAFISPDGVQCTETRFLTIDHIQPFALGGTSTDQSNLRSMCNAHNGYLGRLVFGPRPKVPRQATRQDG